jgi:GntR family transcriptional regulator
MEPVLPVYHQIRRAIKYWVLDKHYLPNSRIPPENELASQFNVNRMTVRQALSSLVQEGLLIRRRGEGTFVTANEDLIQKMSLKHISLTNELLLPLTKSKTLTVKKAEVEPPPLVREKLELNPDEGLVVRIARDRLVPEGFRVFTINYLPLEIGRRIGEAQLMRRPLLKIMEEDLRVNFIEAYQTIEASFADEETASHLGLQPGVPTLSIERIMYTEKGKPVELVNSIYGAGSYKCCLHLKKVKRNNATDWICQITK